MKLDKECIKCSADEWTLRVDKRWGTKFYACLSCKRIYSKQQRELYGRKPKSQAEIDGCKRYRQKHKAERAALQQKREANKKKAVPKWADLDIIKGFYIEASYHQMQVDHIVPLNSKFVCGLHWEGNMQLLTKEENMSKGNRYWPDM